MTENKRNFAIGGIIGIVSIVLVLMGNPANMGFCIACFFRDISGALGLHRAEVVQYIRPEIIGLIFGAFIISNIKGEFKVKGGSSPFTRFILGIVMMIGALIFLGCPLRMLLRIAGGDLNAVVGLVGFVGGVFVGVIFLNKGFSLKRNYNVNKTDGYVFPALNLGLLALLIMAPAFIFFSEKGPGSMHAPILVSLIAGLVVGAIAQRSRICMAGGVRDVFLLKDLHLLYGSIGVLVFALIGNILTKKFNLGFEGQPIAHTNALWNFLGLFIVGWTGTLLGGCPLRQTILAGEGNIDSVITIVGLIVGAAICHNFGLASSGEGVTANGQIAGVICLVILLVVSIMNSVKARE